VSAQTVSTDGRHAYQHEPDARVLVVVPWRHSAGEVAARLSQIAPASRRIAVKTLNSGQDMAVFSASARTIGVVTPKVFHQAVHNGVKGAALVVFGDLHLLDSMYELAIASVLATAKPSRTRIVGISASLNEPLDVASWLCVGRGGLLSFQPKDRDTPIKLTMQTFTIPHSATLLKTMIKPVYTYVKTAPSSSIVFVPSRAACRTVANDLITRSGTEMDLNGFLAVQRNELEPWLRRLSDRSLQETLLSGIGICHEGLSPSDMALTLELFAGGLVRALITPRENCWTLPLRASVVVVMGAQYSGSDRQVQPYSRQELVKMQSLAIRTLGDGAATGGHCVVMCQSEQRDSIARFLNDGLPLESTIAAVLKRTAPSEAISALTHMLGDRPSPPTAVIHGRKQQVDPRRQDLMDLIGWTYLSWRVVSNPVYYDMRAEQPAQQLSALVDTWFDYREPVVAPKGKSKLKNSDPYVTKEHKAKSKAPLAEQRDAELEEKQLKALQDGKDIFMVEEGEDGKEGEE
jgi:antiviral helicase SLH1